MRERWPATTRILLTGYADISSTIAAINRGEVYRYVAKPWDDNDLLLLVRDSLESARLRNENTRLQALTQSQNEQLKGLNASLEDKVVQRTAEIEQINSFLNLANDRLKQNFLVSIKVFSGLMELRGGAMAGHSRRVADLVRKLARRLGRRSQSATGIFSSPRYCTISARSAFPTACSRDRSPKLPATIWRATANTRWRANRR